MLLLTLVDIELKSLSVVLQIYCMNIWQLFGYKLKKRKSFLTMTMKNLIHVALVYKITFFWDRVGQTAVMSTYSFNPDSVRTFSNSFSRNDSLTLSTHVGPKWRDLYLLGHMFPTNCKHTCVPSITRSRFVLKLWPELLVQCHRVVHHQTRCGFFFEQPEGKSPLHLQE